MILMLYIFRSTIFLVGFIQNTKELVYFLPLIFPQKTNFNRQTIKLTKQLFTKVESFVIAYTRRRVYMYNVYIFNILNSTRRRILYYRKASNINQNHFYIHIYILILLKRKTIREKDRKSSHISSL